MAIKVIKKDGSTEDFLPEKISRVLAASGLKPERVEIVTQKVTQWAAETKKEKITTEEIKAKVIEELEKVNPYVAKLFAWYENTKTQHSKQTVDS